jgi:hypothetical protein
MPELSRFFGIIIRMYAELGTPHHQPHFHAYYQDDVAICSFDPVDLMLAHCRDDNSALLWHGLNCTKRNCWLTGSDYKRDKVLSLLSR